MENIISGNLMGGLGNQLFEAAHALSQGWRYNRETVFLPTSWTPGQGREVKHYIDNVFRNLKFVDKIENFTTVGEGHFEFSEVNPVEGNTAFQGYFQSSKNWYGFDEKVREIFQPPTEMVEEFMKKYPQLSQPNTLSLHVRRSEYLQLPDIHPTISIEYIQEALKVIGEYSTVFVFSDDHDFVKENLNFPSVIFVDEDEDYKELWLMGLCQNHIMSNSTFSWWGSFLNKNLNKKIVVPSRWFGPRGPESKDVYESYWHTISCDWVPGGILMPIKKND
jgi:hypothetical protein